MPAAEVEERRLKELFSSNQQRSVYLGGQSGGTANTCPANLCPHNEELEKRWSALHPLG